MEDLENRIKEVIRSAVSRNQLLSLLRVLSCNINLSLQNLLLLYEQKQDAGVVCGKKAWEQLGRSIIDSAVPIQILFPEIELGKDAVMRQVKVYDIGSTEGNMIDLGREILFADRITEMTGMTWEIVPAKAMGESLSQGRFETDHRVFYLSEACPKDQQDQVILDLYLEYVMHETGIKDKLVRMAVLYVLYARWNIKNTIVSALFGKLGKMTEDEKWDFIRTVLFLSKRIVDDMEGSSLSFHETAFVNDLLVSSNIGEMRQTFELASQSISNEEMRLEILLLMEKLSKAGEGCLEKLLTKKTERTLFSYPAMRIELDRSDYFCEKRGGTSWRR